MNFLEKYASVYDMIYSDKDYNKEVAYVDGLIKKYYGRAKTILDFGCGTGKHALEFAAQGYRVHGVDVSPSMVKIASDNALQSPFSSSVTFTCNDVRSVDVHKKFDAVVSLFHVINYQITEKDLLATCTAAAKHLAPGGLFLFDMWYGPAVCALGYQTKVRRLHNDHYAITRISEPMFYPSLNRIDVQFTLFVQDVHTKKIEQFDEQHPMRYLFKEDVTKILDEVGFDLYVFEEWLTGAQPTDQSWSVCCVGRKR